jgi:hypothetical protein
MPDRSQIEMMLDSLDMQKFDHSEFELVLCDSQYEDRKSYVQKLAMKYSFPIVHCSQSPNFWIDKGYYALCNAYNKGMIHARGKLLFNVGDGHKFLTDNAILTMWDWYTQGFFPMGVFTAYDKKGPVYYDAGPKRGQPDRDARWNHVWKRPVFKHNRWDLFYGCSGYSLEAGIKVNGYNSLFNGCKGLDDVDFGVRLFNAGFKNFVIDNNIHVAVYKDVPNPMLQTIDCKANHSLLIRDLEKKIVRANEVRLSMDDVKQLATKTKTNLDYHMWKVLSYDFKTWFENQEIFSIAEERKRVWGNKA